MNVISETFPTNTYPKNRPIGTKKAQSDLPKAKNQIARKQQILQVKVIVFL